MVISFNNINRKIILILMILSVLFSSWLPVLAQENGINLINMNFKGADIRDVLRSIAELAEINLVTDGAVQGVITVQLKDISFEKALDLITRTQGLDYQWDDNTIIVAAPEKIKEIYGKIVTRYIEIKFAELDEIKLIINGINPNLNIQVDQRNQQLIIKGQAHEVEEALQLIKNTDHPHPLTKRIVKIKYSDLNKITEQLHAHYPGLRIEQDEVNHRLLINGKQSELEDALALIHKLDRASEINVIKSVILEYADAQEVKEQLVQNYPDLKIIEDTLNNQLILSGKGAEIEDGLEIISRLDIPSQLVTEILQLRYSKAEELKDSLTALVPEVNIKVDHTAKQLLISGKNNDVKSGLEIGRKIDLGNKRMTEIVKLQHIKAQELTAIINQIYPGVIVQRTEGQEVIIKGKEKELKEALQLISGLDQAGKKMTTVLGINHLDLEEVQEIVTNLYPTLQLQTNRQKKELIIKGEHSAINEVKVLLANLDQPPRQVIIEAKIVEVSHTDLLAIGINPDSLSKIEFFTDEGNNLTGIGFTIPQFLKAIENDGSTNTLANPRLMTINGKEAKLLIGDRIPVKVETGEEGSTIEYIQAGITLEFLPWIAGDNTITMDVRPQVSSIGDSIGTSLPPINTREAETTVRLRDGQTFAIGGLIQDDLIETISRIPLLADIPLLGQLFQHTQRDNRKTEIIIFVTPRIVKEEFPATELPLIGEGEGRTEQHEAEEPGRAGHKEQTRGQEKPKPRGQNLNGSNLSEVKGLSDTELEEILSSSRRRRSRQGDQLPAFYNLLYQVSSGETLVGIADKFGVEPENIKAVNTLAGEKLIVGSSLTIPIPRTHLYRIKPGETLWAIHRRFGVDLALLQELNKINDPENIPIGLILIIPQDLTK